MSTDPLETKFDRFRDATVMTGVGGPGARSNVRRQRRQTALAALLVLLTVGAVFAGLGLEPDRLTPATTWTERVRDARINLGTLPSDDLNCPGPVVRFHDGKATVGGIDYVIADGPMLTADVDRDGRTDYVVTIGCEPAKPPECYRGVAECDRILANRPAYVALVLVLTGEPDDLTAIDGIHTYLQRRDKPAPVRATATEDGRIRMEDDADPEHAYTWRYQDGRMVISR